MFVKTLINTIMKRNFLLIIATLLLLSCGVGYVMYGLWQKERSNSSRWEENYRQIQLDLNTINLNLSEFKGGMDSKVDSILKEAKIKPRYVNEITYITNNYVDTTQTKPHQEKINDSTFTWNDTLGCIKIYGETLLSKGVPTVTIKKKTFNSNSTFIDYTQRRKYPFPSEKLKLWNWRFMGKKERKIKEVSDCGEAKFHKVEVLK